MTFTLSFKRTSIFAATIVLSLAATATANAACSDPAAPNVDWSGCDKHGQYLVTASMDRANLRNTNLNQAVLTSAKLQGADLTSADLSNADLEDARLNNANLSGANLTGANLSFAVLNGADLTGADLTGANLTHAHLSGTIWIDGRICAEGGYSSLGKCDLP